MGCQGNSRRTFVLKLNLHCNCIGCLDKVKKLVKKIQGVDSIKIEDEGKATISGNVDPHTVLKVLEKDKKSAELWGESESPPEVNEPEMQIVAAQNYARKTFDHRKVAPEFRDAIVKPVNKPMAKEIHGCNPKHDHELELRSHNKPFNCDGCLEKGFRTRYRCEPCNFDLHEECMNPKPMITHDLFPKSTFVFCHKPRTKRICDACGRDIHGYSYHCEADNLDLHPRCGNLRARLGIGGTEFELRNKAKQSCFWCKKKRPSWLAKPNVQGWCYVSECEKFYCHVYCVSQMVHEAWRSWESDRNNDDNDHDHGTSRALEKVDLKLVAKSSGSGGVGSSGFLKTISMFLRTIIGILFGDPTVVLLTMLVELIPK